MLKLKDFMYKMILEGTGNLVVLSVLGIAGNKWVPARIGRLYKDKIFFS